MSRAPAQLPLGVGLRDDATFVNYHPGPNASLVNRLAHQLDAEGEPFLYLWGAEGVGRSHLLQAACHAASDRGLRAAGGARPLSATDARGDRAAGSGGHR